MSISVQVPIPTTLNPSDVFLNSNPWLKVGFGSLLLLEVSSLLSVIFEVVFVVGVDSVLSVSFISLFAEELLIVLLLL